MAGGRPSDYTPEIGKTICELLAQGKTLIDICGIPWRGIVGMPDMPSYTSVMRWLEAFPEFRDSYARARDRQADFYADEVGRFAYKATENPKDSNAYRVAGDLMKWQAMIRAPRRYSERMHQTLEHSGQVGVTFTVAGLPDSATSMPDEDAKP